MWYIPVNEAYLFQEGAFLFDSSELVFDLQACLQDQHTSLGVSGGGMRFNDRVVYLDFSGFGKPAGLQFAFINTLAIVPRKFDRYFERRW